MRFAVLGAVLAGTAFAQTDWPTYGNDLAGTRYSPLKQIDTKNVNKLVRAWTYHMNPGRDGASARSTSRGRGPGTGRPGRRRRTQLVGHAAGHQRRHVPDHGVQPVVALEPETAKEIWVYEVKDGAPAVRGLEYLGRRQGFARRRYSSAPPSGKLVRAERKTGKPVPGFGNEGVVDMKPGALNGLENASFGLSSPPIVYKNVVITGAHVQEGPSVGAAGDTRAWDARTGKLVWRFHAVPRPGEVGADTWEKDDWKNRSGTNVWGLFTIDTERGILYQPFGEPTTDYWGGDRKGANLFGTTLVAVDALTGKLKWYFQVVHHDTWDYDLAAPPVLFDVTRNGKKIPAVGRVDQDRGRLHSEPRDRRADLRRRRTQGPGG